MAWRLAETQRTAERCRFLRACRSGTKKVLRSLGPLVLGPLVPWFCLVNLRILFKRQQHVFDSDGSRWRTDTSLAQRINLSCVARELLGHSHVSRPKHSYETDS